MPLSDALLPVTAILAAALSTTGCQRAGQMSQATMAAPASAAATVSPGPSPVSERDRARQEAFANAVKGLRFDSGVVLVEPLGPADPAAAQAHVDAGDQHMAQNLHVEAIAEFGAAARSAPLEATPYERLGWALAHKGKYAEAIAAFRTAVRQEPGSTDHRLALARALEMAGEREQAIAALQEVVAIDSGLGPAHSRLAINLYYTGDYPSAWAHVHAARRAGTNPPPQFIPLLQARMADPGGG